MYNTLTMILKYFWQYLKMYKDIVDIVDIGGNVEDVDIVDNVDIANIVDNQTHFAAGCW